MKLTLANKCKEKEIEAGVEMQRSQARMVEKSTKKITSEVC